MTNLGIEWSYRYCCKHYVGRQSICAKRGSILSADRMLKDIEDLKSVVMTIIPTKDEL